MKLDVAPFEKARDEIVGPFQIDTSSWTNEVWCPVFSVARRVWCVECKLPIPFVDAVCPFCRADQPLDEVENPDRDLDEDGMKDLWELEHGLPDDFNNAGSDSDSDGWTDMEEYLSGTNPSDAKDSPPVERKMRLRGIAARPFQLKFKSVSVMPDGSNKFALNLFRKGKAPRTYFRRLGEAVEGFKLAKYEKKTVMKRLPGWSEAREVDVSVLTLERIGKEIPLIRAVDVQHDEYRVLMTCELSETPIPVLSLEGEFTLLGKKYQLIGIDSANQSVVIKRLHDAELIEFKRYRATAKPSQ